MVAQKGGLENLDVIKSLSVGKGEAVDGGRAEFEGKGPLDDFANFVDAAINEHATFRAGGAEAADAHGIDERGDAGVRLRGCGWCFGGFARTVGRV
ncbi:MAG: hypothetical protein RL077_3479 [Verrucomicrobiota bacterium]